MDTDIFIEIMGIMAGGLSVSIMVIIIKLRERKKEKREALKKAEKREINLGKD